MERAVLVIYKFRTENEIMQDFWLDITSQDEDSDPSENNPFVFSDGTKVEDTNMLIKWIKDGPQYKSTYKCTYLGTSGLDTDLCNSSYNGLCRKKEKCPLNSGSDRSRANLPALFMAASVFKAFYALIGPME